MERQVDVRIRLYDDQSCSVSAETQTGLSWLTRTLGHRDSARWEIQSDLATEFIAHAKSDGVFAEAEHGPSEQSNRSMTKAFLIAGFMFSGAIRLVSFAAFMAGIYIAIFKSIIGGLALVGAAAIVGLISQMVGGFVERQIDGY